MALICSGNLSFLNWLTIVPSLACFDDAALAALWPSAPGGLRDQVLKRQQQEALGVQPPAYGRRVRGAVNVALGVLLAWLSIPVVLNLLSSRQVMNTSFHPLRIVNTYGAFGRYGPGKPGSARARACPCLPQGPGVQDSVWGARSSRAQVPAGVGWQGRKDLVLCVCGEG